MKTFRMAILLIALALPLTAFGQHSVTLNWNASIDAAANPALTYNLYRLNGGCPAGAPATAAALLSAGFTLANGQPIAATSFTDSEIQVGKYCYAATSVLNGAESTPSNFAAAVILPAAPSGLSVSKSN